MIDQLPPPPSRQDPNNFAARADALLAALLNFVTQANALQADVNSKQASAATAASTAQEKAGEAASARDIAMAVVNYKGPWSAQAGALAIPATVLHGGVIWMLTQSVANVALETPGISNKWLDVSPANGLGTAAYASAADFQPAIGALAGLLLSAGDGSIGAATAAQIVAAIGEAAVDNAMHAGRASVADSADAIADGSVSAASKVANGILTWAKMVAMRTGRLIGRSTALDGSPEEIAIGTGLQLSSGTLSCTIVPPVSSVNGKVGAVSLSASDVGAAASGHTHSYADLSALVSAAYIGAAGSNVQYIRFTRANGGTFDVLSYHNPSGG